jgi:hypothetical protein
VDLFFFVTREMETMKKSLLALIAAAVLVLPAAAQTTSDSVLEVRDFAVFVDPPTGFVFVKMPAGWKFVGRVEHDVVANLPAGVITSLLPPGENDAIDVARRMPAGGAKQPGNG